MDLIATAFAALGDAWMMILRPEQLAFLVIGVVLGLSVGVFPGLGGIAGLSLVLPFMFGMDPVSGLALMVGLIAVVPTSDTFASVLLGIPGSTASQATVLDGFPLSKKGQAARALSAAFVSSLFGGLLGACVLSFFILIARPLILAFGLPEMLAITILGLSMVAILAGRLPLKGIVAAGLGLMVGTIGEAGAGGSLRMASYDVPYLLDGLSLVIVGLGIFAIPEIVALLRQDRAISKSGDLGAGWMDGIRDWWRNIGLSIRCSSLGVIVGVIPGLGGSVVDWIAYGFTVQSSKDKSQFGSGDIRGVIGPESSNNAKEGGGLVPTLIFGIPGSGSMAVFLGGLALLGYDPGPHMVRNNLDLTYTIVWSLALANVVGAGLCIVLSNPIARLTTIRFTLVAPFLFMVIAFAAFQSKQSLGDLVALMGVGVLGIFLRRFDWSRPAFLIGFVLSSQAEAFANMANQIAGARFRRSYEAGFDYIFSPITIAILVLTVISIVIGIRQGRHILSQGQPPTGSKRAPLIFLIGITAYLLVAWFDALSISRVGDKIFPVTVGAVTLIGCLVLLIRMMLAPEGHPIFADMERGGEDGNAPHGLWATLGWFAF
ncbi:MAG: tripartite tricarboxylate transporter permease, partial [Tranquillimonas sp.]